MTDINIGAITEALNDKTDRDMRNVDNTAGADAVIEYQMPTAENYYTWYRKYKSGWVEQGGVVSKPNSTQVQVTIPVVMSDTNYRVLVTDEFTGNMGTVPSVGNKTTSGFYVYQNNGSAVYCAWYVVGMAAS